MGDTKIEWADKVWNPTTGCIPVSPGCDHCYAKRMAHRFHRDFATVRMHPERLDQPLHWVKPRRIFVDSVSDLFHRHVSVEFLHQVWDVMERTPQHRYFILTKRPHRMYAMLGEMGAKYGFRHIYLPNVSLGVSVENQTMAESRIPTLLRAAPALTHCFVSCEPLLGPLDLTRWVRQFLGVGTVIVGGESGPGARPMKPEWVRSLRDQCRNVNVSFLFKQWGGLRPGGPALLDGQEHKALM